MERGEVHGQSSSLQYWAISRPDWLSDARISHLLYVGPPDPLGTPGVPYLGDLVTTPADRALVDFIEIGSRLGWPLFAPPGVAQTRVAELRLAFDRLMDDPEFAAELVTFHSRAIALEDYMSEAAAGGGREDLPAVLITSPFFDYYL